MPDLIDVLEKFFQERRSIALGSTIEPCIFAFGDYAIGV